MLGSTRRKVKKPQSPGHGSGDGFVPILSSSKFKGRRAEPDARSLVSLLGSDGKVTRENITGSGKYEDMVATGTVQPLGPFPVVKAGPFQDSNHQTGTYKLK